LEYCLHPMPKKKKRIHECHMYRIAIDTVIDPTFCSLVWFSYVKC